MRLPFVLLFVAASAATAAAQPHERLAVGSLELFGEPGIPAERLSRLRANLLGGFAASGFIVIPEDAVQQKVAQNPTLAQCQSEVCWKALGDAVGAQWVLAGSISVGSSTSYSADLRLVEVASGRPAAQYSNSCGVCTTSEANTWLGLVAADLKRQIDSARTPAPQPPAAAVATTPPPPTVSRTRVWAFRGAAIGALALSVGGFVLGGVYAARNNGHDCTVVPPALDCTGRRNTTDGEAFGLAIGGAFLVSAAVLGYYGFWRYHGYTMALVPAASPTSAAATLHLGF